MYNPSSAGLPEGCGFISGGGSFYPKSRPEYLIQTRDILYVKIYSLNEEMSNLINQTMGANQQNLYQNETSLFINGYVVSDSGNIELPILGQDKSCRKNTG